MKMLYNKIASISEKEGITSTVKQNVLRHGYLTTQFPENINISMWVE